MLITIVKESKKSNKIVFFQRVNREYSSIYRFAMGLLPEFSGFGHDFDLFCLYQGIFLSLRAYLALLLGLPKADWGWIRILFIVSEVNFVYNKNFCRVS